MEFKLKEGLQRVGGVLVAGGVAALVIGEAGIQAIKRLKAADENGQHPGTPATAFETAQWILQAKRRRRGSPLPLARAAEEPLPEPIPINGNGVLVRGPKDPRFAPITLNKS